VVADTNDEGGHQTMHMITETGGEAIFVRTDVSQAVDVQALISKAVATYGRLDYAHNNGHCSKDSGSCVSPTRLVQGLSGLIPAFGT
jgi:NAD(P)-dependent dehydrogenase (short-subunit alcohol dehydrogenase family)